MVSDPDAWELYCRALRQFWQSMASDNSEAKDLCRRAIKLDAEFAAPHALLSRTYFYEVISARSEDPARSVGKGVEHANRALQIDRRDEVGYTVLGYNLAYAQRFVEAFQAIEMGLAINPSSSGLYNARATIAALAPDGDLEQAREDEWLALRLSPNDPIAWTFHATLGLIELVDEESGSVDAAIECLRKAYLYPNADWGVDFFLAVARLIQGRNETAVRHARKAKVTLGHLTGADVDIAFGGLLARPPRFKMYAEQVLKLADEPESE